MAPAGAVCHLEIRWVTRCVILRAPGVASANMKPGVHLSVLCRALVARTAPLFIDIRLSKSPGKQENECGGESYKRCEHRAASRCNSNIPDLHLRGFDPAQGVTLGYALPRQSTCPAPGYSRPPTRRHPG